MSMHVACGENRYRHKRRQRVTLNLTKEERKHKLVRSSLPVRSETPVRGSFLSRQAIIDPGFYATQKTGHFNVDCRFSDFKCRWPPNTSSRTGTRRRMYCPRSYYTLILLIKFSFFFFIEFFY